MGNMELTASGVRKDQRWNVKKERETVTGSIASQDQASDEVTVPKNDNAAAIWTVPRGQQESPDFWMEQRGRTTNELMSVRRYREAGGRNITEIKQMDGTTVRFVFTKRINYSAGADIGRLASLNRVSGVRSLISGVRAYMSQIQCDPYLDKNEVQQAIARMKGVLRRANKKVNDLNNEDSLESVQRRAIESEKIAKAEKIAEELKQRRLERKIREQLGSSPAKGPMPGISSDLSYESEQRSDELAVAAIEMGSIVAAEMAAVSLVSAELSAQAIANAASGSVDVAAGAVDVMV